MCNVVRVYAGVFSSSIYFLFDFIRFSNGVGFGPTTGLPLLHIRSDSAHVCHPLLSYRCPILAKNKFPFPVQDLPFSSSKALNKLIFVKLLLWQENAK